MRVKSSYWDEKGYNCENNDIKSYLTFIKVTRTVNSGKMGLYRCECGKEKEFRIYKVVKGIIKSCGCHRYDFARLEPGQGAFNALYRSYKYQAKRDNRKFDLSKEEFKKLVENKCIYCGSEPSSIYGSTNYRTTYGDYTYNGIDRINSNNGYTIDNCVPCCEKCNRMKWILSEEEFLEHIRKIYNNKKL